MLKPSSNIRQTQKIHRLALAYRFFNAQEDIEKNVYSSQAFQVLLTIIDYDGSIYEMQVPLSQCYSY